MIYPTWKIIRRLHPILSYHTRQTMYVFSSYGGPRCTLPRQRLGPLRTSFVVGVSDTLSKEFFCVVRCF